MNLKQLIVVAIAVSSLNVDAQPWRSTAKPEPKGVDKIVEYITSVEQYMVDTQEVIVAAQRRGATDEEVQLALAKHALAKKQAQDRNVAYCRQTNGIVEYVSGGFICRYLAR